MIPGTLPAALGADMTAQQTGWLVLLLAMAGGALGAAVWAYRRLGQRARAGSLPMAGAAAPLIGEVRATPDGRSDPADPVGVASEPPASGSPAPAEGPVLAAIAAALAYSLATPEAQSALPIVSSPLPQVAGAPASAAWVLAGRLDLHGARLSGGPRGARRG